MISTKKLFALVLTLVLCCCAEGAVAAAGTVKLPKGTTEVPSGSFRGNTSLTHVILQDGATRIGDYAFADTDLTVIDLPLSLQGIGLGAFENTCLTTVNAPVGSYAWRWAEENLTEYRALLIGEKTFLKTDKDGCYYIETAKRNENDVYRVKGMLEKLNGMQGGKFQITTAINPDYDGILSSIQETFAGTTQQDVSLVYIATHGALGDGALEMPFKGKVSRSADIERYVTSEKRRISFETLAMWLDENIQGKVIVILEACGSGAAIYETTENGTGTRNTKGTTADSPKAFTEMAIKAFGAIDPGIPDPNGSSLRKTGELRQPKFYVLTAADYRQSSYGTETEDGSGYIGNYMTRWLLEAVGEKGNTPADKDGNSVFSMVELFDYIRAKNFSYNDNHPETQQSVQCYPSNSGFEWFKYR